MTSEYFWIISMVYLYICTSPNERHQPAIKVVLGIPSHSFARFPLRFAFPIIEMGFIILMILNLSFPQFPLNSVFADWLGWCDDAMRLLGVSFHQIFIFIVSSSKKHFARKNHPSFALAFRVAPKDIWNIIISWIDYFQFSMIVFQMFFLFYFYYFPYREKTRVFPRYWGAQRRRRRRRPFVKQWGHQIWKLL